VLTLGLLLLIVIHIVRCDLVQELDIVVRVELGHFTLGRRLCSLRRVMSVSVPLPSSIFRHEVRT
jgi:hypothetical protein